MIYRATATLVVAFWLTMTALLLRNEIRPGDSSLREVPVGHVIKLIFHHQQVSDLNITSDRLRLGRLRLMPKSDKVAGLRTIGFEGNLQVIIPGAKRQRMAWRGEIVMDKALETQRFQVGLTLNEPAPLRTEIVVLPNQNIARYELNTASTQERQQFTLDENGLREVMQQLGLDPTALAAVTLPKTSAPVVKAQQSSIEIHGERIDTYLITIESNGQTWLECHVSQLGQVLRATTLLGYTLSPDDITP